MKAIIQKNFLLISTIGILAICVGLMSIFSGFQHETPKLMSMFLNVFLVIILLFLVADTVKFLLLAVDSAFWPRQQEAVNTDLEATTHTRTDYLKMRLNTLRSQLVVTEEHRNENLNLMYQLIARDLRLYGKYFFFLMCLVLVTREELLYYDTRMKTNLYLNNQTHSMGLNSVRNLDHLYAFIESLVITFEPNKTETGLVNWFYGDHTSKLGVVRLRQLRKKENAHTGWEDPEFSSLDYLAKWELPYRRMQYTDKYWRIYEPWLPISPTFTMAENIFLNFEYEGYFQSYPEQKGYVTLLARSYNNSMKVIQYLERKRWLTWNTSAVFMDFTLFNVDSNIFTICNLLVEQTPFGTVVPTVSIISVRLQLFAQLGSIGLVVLLIYIIVLIQFAKSVVVTLWFETYRLRSMWNKVDLVILLLNIGLIIIVTVREIMVVKLLSKVESTSKTEFLDFRLPTRLHELTSILIGFLVCVTTLRLWRVLQFASVFQLFTETLYSAWQALASTAMIILIFLIAFGIAVVIINGNNAVSFSKLFKSIVSSMSFAFGFSSHITPKDLFHGGTMLGFFMYLILVFAVVMLMMNLFVSTISDYFTLAKHQRDVHQVRRINFLQFLRVEYAGIFRFFQKLTCFNRAYKRHNRTVAENIKHILDEKQRLNAKSRYEALSTRTRLNVDAEDMRNEQMKKIDYNRRIERMFTVAAIIQTQMELLEHLLFKEEDVNVSSSDVDEDEDSESDSDYV